MCIRDRCSAVLPVLLTQCGVPGAMAMLSPTAIANFSSPSVISPLPWVNPARCVRVCEHPDESRLVSTDARGKLAAGPARVDVDAQPSFEALIAAAAAAGHDLSLGETFRTYATQSMVWERKLNEPGIAARPGHSEHELGLAADLQFAESVYPWLLAHAWEHGFVQSYPDGADKVTGFRFEPWHFRWVGSARAKQLHEQPGLTLEELFETTPGLGESGDCSDYSQRCV